MDIKKTPISAPHILNEAYDYDKPATFVRGADIAMGPFHLILLSGTASVDEQGVSIHRDDFAGQTKRMFQNVTELLTAANVTWHDVIRTTIYIKNIDRDYEEFCRLRKEFYDTVHLPFYPASTCIGAQICRPELLLEMEVWALKND